MAEKHSRKYKKNKASAKSDSNKESRILGKEKNEDSATDAGTNPNKPKSQHQTILARWKKVSLPTKLTVLCTLIIAVATVIYSFFAYRQWLVMRGQLKQMESATRPWVGLAEDNGAQADPITIDAASNVKANCVVTARNYGTYPAQNVLPFCGLMVLHGNITPVHEKIRELCRGGTPPFGGSVLFQGHKDTWRWAASVSKSEIIPDASGGPFYIFLIASIRYRDQVNVGHCSAFGFKRNFPGTINTVSFELAPNTTIPGEWVKWDGVVDP